MKISILAILPLIVLIGSAMMVSGLNPLVGDDWEDDIDGDGLISLDEFLAGSDPNNWDTDGDGLIDSEELSFGLDPNDWDTDNDMLVDGIERGAGESTDGHVVDSDNDGIA